MLKTTRRTQARLRLVVDNERESDGGYISGRSSCLGTPDAASTESTRSAGTLPERRHFCTAWYRTPHFSAKGCSPPPPSIARSTTLMSSNLQLPVAISQQPRGALLFPTMQLMVANGKTEKEHFREALNVRVAQDHADVRGRPVWLHDELQKYRRTHRRFQSVGVSKQICAYWLKGEKLPTGDRLQLLCAALGMTRGQLFGETHDERLSLIIKRWEHLPEHIKRGLHSMVAPDEEDEAPEIAEPRTAAR